MIVVSNTSPISNLIQIGRVDLLVQLFGPVHIPPAVAGELRTEHELLPAFLQVRRPSDLPAVEQLSAVLDRGEAEAIVLAREAGADRLLIDEKAGRRAAQEAGLRIIGLAGVLLLAKRQGLIPNVRELLDRLLGSGFYLESAVVRAILAAAGE